MLTSIVGGCELVPIWGDLDLVGPIICVRCCLWYVDWWHIKDSAEHVACWARDWSYSAWMAPFGKQAEWLLFAYVCSLSTVPTTRQKSSVGLGLLLYIVIESNHAFTSRLHPIQFSFSRELFLLNLR